MKQFFQEAGRVIGTLAAVLIMFGLFIYALSTTIRAERDNEFKRVYAKCQLEILQKEVQPKDEVRYLYLCMNSHGFDDNEFSKRVDAHGIPL